MTDEAILLPESSQGTFPLFPYLKQPLVVFYEVNDELNIKASILITSQTRGIRWTSG